MINQDDVLQHYRYKKRRKSGNVSKSKGPSGVIGGAGGVQLAGTIGLRKADDALVRRKIRKLGREIKAKRYKKFKDYTKAMISPESAVTRAEKVKKAIEEFRVVRSVSGNRITIDGGNPIGDYLKEKAELKKANNRSRQQHGEVQVRSYRRNGKIVRGYKRARRASRGGTR